MSLLNDLQLDPEDIVVLILAWKFRAATQCEFTKQEWLQGMTVLGYVTLKLRFTRQNS